MGVLQGTNSLLPTSWGRRVCIAIGAGAGGGGGIGWPPLKKKNLKDGRETAENEYGQATFFCVLI